MAPKSWASDPQLELLMRYVPLYKSYQASTKQYQPFWDKINALFIQNWPILAPGVTPDSLNEEESEAYTKALTKLYSVSRVESPTCVAI
jgi:hypothetical protein